MRPRSASSRGGAPARKGRRPSRVFLSSAARPSRRMATSRRVGGSSSSVPGAGRRSPGVEAGRRIGSSGEKKASAGIVSTPASPESASDPRGRWTRPRRCPGGNAGGGSGAPRADAAEGSSPLPSAGASGLSVLRIGSDSDKGRGEIRNEGWRRGNIAAACGGARDVSRLRVRNPRAGSSRIGRGEARRYSHPGRFPHGIPTASDESGGGPERSGRRLE